MVISHGHKATRRSPRLPSSVGAHRPNRPLVTHSPTACRAARQRPQRRPRPAIAHPGNPQSGAYNGAILIQPEPTARHVFPPSPQPSSGGPDSPPTGKLPPTHGPTDSTATTATRSSTTTTASTTRASTHPGHTPSWARHRPAPATMAGQSASFFSHPKHQSDQLHDGQNHQRRCTTDSKIIVASRQTALVKTTQNHLVNDQHDIVPDPLHATAGKPAPRQNDRDRSRDRRLNKRLPVPAANHHHPPQHLTGPASGRLNVHRATTWKTPSGTSRYGRRRHRSTVRQGQPSSAEAEVKQRLRGRFRP